MNNQNKMIPAIGIVGRTSRGGVRYPREWLTGGRVQFIKPDDNFKHIASHLELMKDTHATP